MKSKLAVLALVAALLAPQGALWADETSGGTPAPTTTSAPSAKVHKKHKHHKKAKPTATPAPAATAPSSTPQ
jgi:hypothetical protein